MSRSFEKNKWLYFFGTCTHIDTCTIWGYQKNIPCDWYINRCLPKMLDAWNRQHAPTGTRGLLVGRDKAGPHTTDATVAYTCWQMATYHNRLNHHLFSKFGIGQSDLCSCQTCSMTAEHLPQACPLHDTLCAPARPAV